MVRSQLGIAMMVFLAAGTAGCRQQPTTQPSGKANPSLMLFCGAGIQLPVSELVEAFSRENGCRIEADYAGSEVLLSRIKLKQKGDLYMPGEKAYMDMAAEAGLIESSVPVCCFVPAILVRKGNPRNIRSLSDLTRQGVRLGLGDPKACAVGRQSREIFAKNHIPWSEVAKTLAFQSLTVNELGIQIQAGSLDAVIVWDAVGRQYLGHGELVEIPPKQNLISTVPVGVLRFSQNKELAGRFVAFATSQRGRAILVKHNYRVDLPQGAGQ